MSQINVFDHNSGVLIHEIYNEYNKKGNMA